MIYLNFGYYNSFTYASAGIGYSIIKALAIILVVIGGMFFFKEQLNLVNMIGIGIIILGIIMISWNR